MSATTAKTKRSPRKTATRAGQGGASQKLQQRAQALLEREIEFVFNPEFEGLSEAEAVAATEGEDVYVENKLSSEQRRSLRQLPPFVASLYTMPLLTPSGEASLFRLMNFLKYRANQLRARLDPQQADADLCQEIERLMVDAEQMRNRIVRCNLRLVVSIVRQNSDSWAAFDDLVSEGNLVLMKAVDKFDYGRGFRFSTYVTHSVQRHLYRVFQRQQRRRKIETPTSDEFLFNSSEATPDEEPIVEEQVFKQLLKRMPDYLDQREQFILRERFGLGPSGVACTLQNLSDRIGLSKERVRQLHHRALEKLRGVLLELEPGLIPG